MKARVTTSLAATLLLGAVSAQGGADAGQAAKAPDKPAKQEPLKVGAAVPADLKLSDLDGKEFTFESARGKVVVIHFWSIVCPYERVAEPKIHKISEDYAGKDVVVLAINANQGEIGEKPTAESFKGEDKPYAALRKHVEKTKLNHTVLVDHGGNVGRLFGAKTTPHCFVIDAKGVLRYQGALDSDSQTAEGGVPYVRNAIDAVMAGKEIEESTTKPYG
jgi:thiol-disulfide isomerase/thioredoxin